MIIDCHGHFTGAPAQLAAYRAALTQPDGGRVHPPTIDDETVAATLRAGQLRVMRERGIDVELLSPQASAMGHHLPDPAVAQAWARASNDLVHQASRLFPTSFAPVCQLPQTPGGELGPLVHELRRCVDLGFVACNLNPDPSGGHWTSPPLTDESWFGLYEVMVELEVPAMIHVSASCTPAASTLGAHYLNADTSVFMQLLEGDLFNRFPTLRLVIPHGGGAVPYHWGRYRGLAERLGRPPLTEHLMRNVGFDTCVYHRPGMELLVSVVNVENVLFASEMLGAVRGADPETGIEWDDTRRYLEAMDLTADVRHAIFEGNVRRLYPRLDTRLRAQAGLQEAGSPHATQIGPAS